MANKCYTNIWINCQTEKKAAELFDKIEKWTSHNYKDNGFGLLWLGNIVGNSGIDAYDETGDFAKYRCRGEIYEYEMNGEEITIHTETAWCPMLQMWKAVCDKYCPDAEIRYEAEEPGDCLYLTNEPDLYGTYNLDSWTEKVDSIWDCNKETLIDVLKEFFNSDSEDLEYYQNLLDEGDYGFSFHEWKKTEISECC